MAAPIPTTCSCLRVPALGERASTCGLSGRPSAEAMCWQKIHSCLLQLTWRRSRAGPSLQPYSKLDPADPWRRLSVSLCSVLSILALAVK
eukprot:1786302-Prymnesium_polylepis.1